MKAIIFCSGLFVSCFQQAGFAASLDCGKTASAIDKLVCTDQSLVALGERLAQTYSAARSTLQASDAEIVEGEQQSWLNKVSNTCEISEGGTVKTLDEKRKSCLEKVYSDRIEDIRNLRLPSSYGVLRYHIVGAEAASPMHYILELYNRTVGEKGPLGEKLKCASNASGDCGFVNPPTGSNTVIFEYGNGGSAVGYRARFRAFLTTSDKGSGNFTVPKAALDFEYSEKRSMALEKLNVSDIVVSLTGIAPLSNDRLPHLAGLPEPSGCLGCPQK